MIDWDKPLECGHGDVSNEICDSAISTTLRCVSYAGITYLVDSETGENCITYLLNLNTVIDLGPLGPEFTVRNKHSMWMAKSSDEGVEITEYNYDEKSLKIMGWSCGGYSEFFKCFETKDAAKIGITERLKKEIIKISGLIDSVGEL